MNLNRREFRWGHTGFKIKDIFGKRIDLIVAVMYILREGYSLLITEVKVTAGSFRKVPLHNLANNFHSSKKNESDQARFNFDFVFI